jgi:hypothetical protein
MGGYVDSAASYSIKTALQVRKTVKNQLGDTSTREANKQNLNLPNKIGKNK